MNIQKECSLIADRMFAADSLTTLDAEAPQASVIGSSKEGRPIHGFLFGRGKKKISLIAGCHADEPVGTILLERLIEALASTEPQSVLFEEFTWYIVPQVNPDGAARNAEWQRLNSISDAYCLASYLKHSVREAPGEDIEFCFPFDGDKTPDKVRHENKALVDFWDAAFSFHASLHGMAFAAGPWFLLDPKWQGHLDSLIDACSSKTKELSYVLHDIERNGEKGFQRIARGFCTRPNYLAMRQFFLDKNDFETASLFKASSMDYVQSLGGDPLTLVTEMPLFVLPGVGESIVPEDKIALEWKKKIETWKTRLELDLNSFDLVRSEIEASEILPMPVIDQVKLQWTAISESVLLI